MIQIKTYFYHFDLLSFDPLSYFWHFVVWPFADVSFKAAEDIQKLSLDALETDLKCIQTEHRMFFIKNIEKM